MGDLALRIGHIGSTSVPNLPAKDRIDIHGPSPARPSSRRRRAAHEPVSGRTACREDSRREDPVRRTSFTRYDP
ncbi:MAG: GrpB family protein [Chloroflexota bacterium]